MSRVKIRQLLYECTQPMSPDDYAKMQKILDTEITPRRVIEKLIEHYDKIIDDSEKEIAYFKKNSDAGHTATIRKSCVWMLKVYAETLLKEFEGEEENEYD